uniref:PARP catalytic domain-containing protein n=1 Tax=Oryzias latipes TaxID=8090 RepID=A0A3P9LZD5_ORYLA
RFASCLTEGLSFNSDIKGVYKMFHGTSVACARLIIANGFKQSSTGLLGKGVYVSRDQKKAQAYPRNASSSDRVVFELSVRVGRVKRIDKDNHPLLLTWSSNGYDTAWIPPNCGMQCVPSGLEEDCVFDPKRVKVVGIFYLLELPLPFELDVGWVNNKMTKKSIWQENHVTNVIDYFKFDGADSIF